MFLSRLQLLSDAPRQPAFWQRLGDVYSLHKEVWRLFSDNPDKRRDFLYRLDLHRGRPQLYTLSPEPPHDPDRIWKIETKPFQPVLETDDRLAFALRANPTIKRDGSRHDVVMDAKRKLREQGIPPNEDPPTQAELVGEYAPRWLESKTERLGIELCEVRADGYHVHQFQKPAPNGKRPRNVTIATCDFTGILEVKEPKGFLRSVTEGIGPAKGFGCGLTLLRRVR